MEELKLRSMFTNQSFVERVDSDCADPINKDIRLYDSDSDDSEEDGITDTFIMVENLFKNK